MPRLSVFRSNKNIYAQIIDDIKGNTLASASSNSKDFDKFLKENTIKKKFYVKNRLINFLI